MQIRPRLLYPRSRILLTYSIHCFFMHKILLLTCGLLAAVALAAQADSTANPYVFGAAGGTAILKLPTTQQIEFSWTLGEVAVMQHDVEDVRFTEGFFQTWLELFKIPSENRNVNMTITCNGDGKNDSFTPVLDINTRYPNNEIFVFNRWGVLVYQAKPYDDTWCGTNFNGQDLPEGTYYYILRLSNNFNSQMQGSLTVRR